MSNVVMSDGHGNVIRHTNPRRIGDSSSRGAGGVFGWTEDDSAPEAGLGAEFENALREVMEQANARTEAGSAAVGASAGVDASAGANTPQLLRVLPMPMKQMPHQRLPDREEPIQKSMALGMCTTIALKPLHHLLLVMKDLLLKQTMSMIMQFQ